MANQCKGDRGDAILTNHFKRRRVSSPRQSVALHAVVKVSWHTNSEGKVV